MYPTVNYASKDNYLKSFQGKYQQFVEENAIPKKKNDKILIKYYGSVEKIIEKPISRISDKYYIWTRNHVKNYISGNKALIWLLRIYSLKEPVWAEPTPGAIRYANLKNDVSLDGIEPILNDSEFSKIAAEIK